MGEMSPKPNLDLLRAIAVILVIADHALRSAGIDRFGSWYSGDVGLFGVYLFFVHTSLVLMWSLERRPNALDFYVRRIFRIYPLAVITILFAYVTHAPVANITATGAHFTANADRPRSLVMNLLLVRDLIGKGAAPIIHGVTWSLAPELYMYILLPALFVYARFTRKIWTLLPFWVLAALHAHAFAPPGNLDFATMIRTSLLASSRMSGSCAESRSCRLGYSCLS